MLHLLRDIVADGIFMAYRQIIINDPSPKTLIDIITSYNISLALLSLAATIVCAGLTAYTIIEYIPKRNTFRFNSIWLTVGLVVIIIWLSLIVIIGWFDVLISPSYYSPPELIQYYFLNLMN